MFKPTLVKNYVHIYSKDPAIDQEMPEYDPDRWARTGEAKYLPLKPGSEPIRFTLQHLGARAKALLMDKSSQGLAQSLVEAVALALVGIENGQMADGSPFDVTFDNSSKDRLRRCSEETIDILYSVDDGKLVHELGDRVAKESFGDPT